MLINHAYIDFDSVIWALNLGLLKLIEEKEGLKLTDMDIITYDYYHKHYPYAKNFWENWDEYKSCGVLEGSKEFINELSDIFYGNVTIITATPNALPFSEKNKLIREHFGSHLNIIHASEKAEHTFNGLLIDDHLKNIIDHTEKHHLPAIIYDGDYGWNQERIEDGNPYIKRAKNYTETLSHTKTFLETFNEFNIDINDKTNNYTHIIKTLLEKSNTPSHSKKNEINR